MRYTQNPRYTYVKNSTYYFSKTVPADLRSYYSKSRIVLCLHTKHRHQASQAAKAIQAKLNDYWLRLRLKDLEVPAAHLLYTSTSHTAGMPTISDAVQVYLDTKGAGRKETFHKGTKRNIKYLTDCLGIRSLDQYSTSDAGTLRDWLKGERNLGIATIHRIFASIKAVVGFAIKELGLELRNPFAGAYLPPVVPSNRKPVGITTIRSLQARCYEMNDDLRILLALLTDTGMRLAEATGLHIKDLCLEHPTPHLKLRPHAWRTLKTPSSERKIPLVGASLWAARRLVETQTDFCFPRYTNNTSCNSNSASAALNKWIKQEEGEGIVVHGLRHSFRDRLRAVSAPSDMVDSLGGWSLQTVGQSYGEGYPLAVMAETMQRALEA